jgi:calcium-dependent protein kinase
LKLYEYFEDDKNVYLVTELCKGGELFDKIIEKEFFSEKEAAKIFK